MKNFPDIKITNVLTIVMGCFFLIITVMIVLLVNQGMKQQALIEAEAKARILIDRNLATHTYFSHILKPRVFEWTAPFRSPDYFDPSWMSSTYAIRGIHKYFDALNPAGYYIKDAALDARSPENEADDYERAFLDKLKNDRSLESYSEIRTLDGKPYLAVLRRGETMEASCLRCHSTPGSAPKDLLKHYESDRSFHRNAGDLVSTISLRIPLSAAYEGMYQTFKKLSILLAILLALLFGVQTFLYRRFLSLPIGIIRDKAKEIAENEEQLGGQISEPTGRELRELAVAFNEMSLRLRAGRDHLEDRIEERTRELSASNEHLEREVHQRRVVEDELRERNKELKCLYSIVGMVEESSTIEEIIQKSADLIPGGYYYSELACARITLKDQAFKTRNFQETKWRISADILSKGELLGVVEVYYLTEISGKEEGPFLEEEHDLIRAIAERLGRVIERKQAEEKLKASEEQVRLLLNSTAEAIYGIDIQGRCTFANPSCLRMLGYEDTSQLLGKNMHTLIHHSTPDGIPMAIEDCRIYRALQEGKGVQVDDEVLWKVDGTSFPVEYFSYPQLVNGKVSGGVVTFLDITKRKKAEEDLRESERKYRELSIVDNLTRLYNSRYFYGQLEIEIDRFNRYGEPLTLILLDIDDFKSFNDTYGHVEGDQVLSGLGQVIKRCLRKTDSGYRYGGEEFTVLLPVTRSEAGLITAERIRTEFKKETFSPWPGQSVHLTTSIGIAQYRPDEGMKAFVQRVDQLMYQAKKKGKDRICSEL